MIHIGNCLHILPTLVAESVHFVNVSGGRDSTTTHLLALEFGRWFHATFSDTGKEKGHRCRPAAVFPHAGKAWSNAARGSVDVSALCLLNQQRFIPAVVVQLSVTVSSKAIRKVDSKLQEHSEVLAENSYVSFISCVYKGISSANPTPRLDFQHWGKVFAQLVQGSVVADQGGEIIPNFVAKIVDAIQNLLRSRQEGSPCCLKRASDRFEVRLFYDALGIDRNSPVAAFDLKRKLQWKFRYLMQKKPHNDARARLAGSYGFVMLLLRDSFCIFRNCRRLSRSSVSCDSHHHCSHSSGKPHSNPSPVGYVPDVRSKRTDLNRHFPSLLKPVPAMSMITLAPPPSMQLSNSAAALQILLDQINCGSQTFRDRSHMPFERVNHIDVLASIVADRFSHRILHALGIHGPNNSLTQRRARRPEHVKALKLHQHNAWHCQDVTAFLFEAFGDRHRPLHLHVMRKVADSPFPINQRCQQQGAQPPRLIRGLASAPPVLCLCERERNCDSRKRTDGGSPACSLCTPDTRNAHDADCNSSPQRDADQSDGGWMGAEFQKPRPERHASPAVGVLIGFRNDYRATRVSESSLVRPSPISTEAFNDAFGIFSRSVRPLGLSGVAGCAAAPRNDVHDSTPKAYGRLIGDVARGNHERPAIHIERACHV